MPILAQACSKLRRRALPSTAICLPAQVLTSSFDHRPSTSPMAAGSTAANTRRKVLTDGTPCGSGNSPPSSSAARSRPNSTMPG